MPDVISLIKEYSYLGIFIIVFLESGIFFLLPGDSLLFAFGLLASSGYVDIYTGIVLILIAAIGGGGVGYSIGQYIEALSNHKYLKNIFKKDKIEETKVFLNKHGTKTILLARFVPVVRTFAPMLAGFAKMDKKLFWKYNIIGAFVWGVGITVLGYVFGNKFSGIEKHITLISVVIIAISLLPFAISFVNKKFRKI